MSQSTPSAMTKTQATALARQARQYGYFKSGDTVSLNCPQCHEHQSTGIQYRTFPAPKGAPANVDPATGKRTVFRRERDTEALDRMMVNHLEHCGQD